MNISYKYLIGYQLFISSSFKDLLQESCYGVQTHELKCTKIQLQEAIDGSEGETTCTFDNC